MPNPLATPGRECEVWPPVDYNQPMGLGVLQHLSTRPSNKGLVTVALLKSLYDTHQDRVGMFQPLLLEAVATLNRADFDTLEIQQEFLQRNGILIPIPVMRTLLARAGSKGAVRRKAGRYFRNASGLQAPSPLAADRTQVEADHAALAHGLASFASAKGFALGADPLDLMLRFLEENQIAILLDSEASWSLVPPPSLTSRQALILADFITSVCLMDERLSSILRRMLEGLVIHNALLSRDISSEPRQFHGLAVYLDTTFVLDALGLNGASANAAARDSMAALKGASVGLNVFEDTIRELRNVLAALQRHLETSEGRASLRPSSLARHLIDEGFTPADVRQEIDLLERRVRSLGITIRGRPNRDSGSTLNETDFATRIATNPNEPFAEDRVCHDVDCVASILSLRGQGATDSIELARYFFLTTSTSLIRSSDEWYRSQGGTGVGPVISVHRLTMLAWLKNPALAPNLKLHELVAVCTASLRPGARVWKAFTKHLRRLVDQKSLNSDDEVAILVSSLTEQELLRWEEKHDGDDVDASSVAEIVDRVQAENQRHVTLAIAESDRRVAAAQAATRAAEGTAKSEQRARLEDRGYTEARLHTWADRLAWLIFVLAFAAVAVGSLEAGSPRSLGWVWRLPATLCAVVCFWITVTGGSLWGFRTWFSKRLYLTLLRMLLPPPADRQ